MILPMWLVRWSLIWDSQKKKEEEKQKKNNKEDEEVKKKKYSALYYEQMHSRRPCRFSHDFNVLTHLKENPIAPTVWFSGLYLVSRSLDRKWLV